MSRRDRHRRSRSRSPVHRAPTRPRNPRRSRSRSRSPTQRSNWMRCEHCRTERPHSSAHCPIVYCLYHRTYAHSELTCESRYCKWCDSRDHLGSACPVVDRARHSLETIVSSNPSAVPQPNASASVMANAAMFYGLPLIPPPPPLPPPPPPLLSYAPPPPPPPPLAAAAEESHSRLTPPPPPSHPPPYASEFPPMPPLEQVNGSREHVNINPYMALRVMNNDGMNRRHDEHQPRDPSMSNASVAHHRHHPPTTTTTNSTTNSIRAIASTPLSTTTYAPMFIKLPDAIPSRVAREERTVTTTSGACASVPELDPHSNNNKTQGVVSSTQPPPNQSALTAEKDIVITNKETEEEKKNDMQVGRRQTRKKASAMTSRRKRAT